MTTRATTTTATMARKVIVGYLMFNYESDKDEAICRNCYEKDLELLRSMKFQVEGPQPIHHPAPDGIYLGRELSSSQNYWQSCGCCGWRLSQESNASSTPTQVYDCA